MKVAAAIFAGLCLIFLVAVALVKTLARWKEYRALRLVQAPEPLPDHTFDLAERIRTDAPPDQLTHIEIIPEPAPVTEAIETNQTTPPPLRRRRRSATLSQSLGYLFDSIVGPGERRRIRNLVSQSGFSGTSAEAVSKDPNQKEV
jgi:hypothetical protein